MLEYLQERCRLLNSETEEDWFLQVEVLRLIDIALYEVMAESLPGAGTGVRPRTLLGGVPLHSPAGCLQQGSWSSSFLVFQTFVFLKFG